MHAQTFREQLKSVLGHELEGASLVFRCKSPDTGEGVGWGPQRPFIVPGEGPTTWGYDSLRCGTLACVRRQRGDG